VFNKACVSELTLRLVFKKFFQNLHESVGMPFLKQSTPSVFHYMHDILLYFIVHQMTLTQEGSSERQATLTAFAP
jgi:hypothetical protein